VVRHQTLERAREGTGAGSDGCEDGTAKGEMRRTLGALADAHDGDQWPDCPIVDVLEDKLAGGTGPTQRDRVGHEHHSSPVHHGVKKN
jgi:hypothetical protein